MFSSSRKSILAVPFPSITLKALLANSSISTLNSSLISAGMILLSPLDFPPFELLLIYLSSNDNISVQPNGSSQRDVINFHHSLGRHNLFL